MWTIKALIIIKFIAYIGIANGLMIIVYCACDYIHKCSEKRWVSMDYYKAQSVVREALDNELIKVSLDSGEENAIVIFEAIKTIADYN